MTDVKVDHDLESSKDAAYVTTSEEKHTDNYGIFDGGEGDYDVYNTWYGRFFAPLRRAEAFLDRRVGVEALGPARVLPNERHAPGLSNMIWLWASGTSNMAAFSIGLIPSQLGLDLKRSIVIIIFGTICAGTLNAWCACAGPKSGLRQVSMSRYSLGWYPSKIIAVLNVIAQLGWAAVSAISSGLALTAASDGTVSLALGIVIVSVVGALVSCVGLRAVLAYERYAWIPVVIIFLIMYGEAGRQADNLSPSFLQDADLAGAALTWFTIVYGSACWMSIVSDFYVEYPEYTPSWKVFSYTLGGMSVPTCFAQILGACVGSTVLVNTDWAGALENGLGYLIQEILYPPGFAKFLLVLLVLSGIGNICICVYAGALSAQQIAKPMTVVPRFVWTLCILAGMLLLGLIGRDHLLVVLQNFLSLLGYWNTSFFVILFEEHYIFRKGNWNNYDFRAWNTRKLMPVGYAGFFAFFVGFAGWFMGLSVTWYTGVIGRMIGNYGGDIGNELSFGFTAVAYPPARWLELKLVGR